MNEGRKQKIKNLINDPLANDAVKTYLIDEFTKKRPDRDVTILAAQQLALEMLRDAWQGMERIAQEKEKHSKVGTQVGM